MFRAPCRVSARKTGSHCSFTRFCKRMGFSRYRVCMEVIAIKPGGEGRAWATRAVLESKIKADRRGPLEDLESFSNTRPRTSGAKPWRLKAMTPCALTIIVRALCITNRTRSSVHMRIMREQRRGGRVVEGARLESVYTGNRIAGSNPAPSARTAFAPVHHLSPLFLKKLFDQMFAGISIFTRSPSSTIIQASACRFFRGFGGQNGTANETPERNRSRAEE
jgi:hypothetical protein